MDQLTEKIRELASTLLKDGKVDMVIGFADGTLPMTSRPFLATESDKAAQLVWNSFCSLNLTNYITGRKEKIALFAKGCDSRNVVNHIVENKISRDQLHIIGVPCQGMVDKKAILKAVGGEITGLCEEGDKLTVSSSHGDVELNKNDYLRDNCATCTHRNPVIYDELAAPLVEEQTVEEPFADVAAIEKMEPVDKARYFDNLIKDCIRCYACRNACPLCYCPTCFVDESGPQWVGKGQNPTDIQTFHFLRAFHCAGRCTDCGACEAACPMDIHVRAFTRKLNKDALELFGWEAGLDTEKRPPLDTFNPDDPDEFIR
ncbi:MAG: 4Fe-4S dicluster domain-containing protein [Desulfamplus sp.]|nr:4Fe-4S dicluster domain-containing protein [Desulfamplus sp.]